MIEQLETVECLRRHGLCFRRGVAMHFLQRKLDVPAGGEMGKQVELLKQKSIPPAIGLERLCV